MDQRLSILPQGVPKPPSEELVRPILAYMILSGAAETPPAFLDLDELRQVLLNPASFDSSALNQMDPPGEYGNLSECMADLMVISQVQGTPVGCIIHFDNGSKLMAAAANYFYFLDPFHGIFVQTSGPEYDVVDYVALHGSDGYRIEFFGAPPGSAGGAAAPVAPPPEEPAKKKIKKEGQVKKK